MHLTKYFRGAIIPDATVKVECGMNGCEVEIMDTVMFHTPIKTILLLVIHSSKNKMEEIDGFALNFHGI